MASLGRELDTELLIEWLIFDLFSTHSVRFIAARTFQMQKTITIPEIEQLISEFDILFEYVPDPKKRSSTSSRETRDWNDQAREPSSCRSCDFFPFELYRNFNESNMLHDG